MDKNGGHDHLRGARVKEGAVKGMLDCISMLTPCHLFFISTESFVGSSSNTLCANLSCPPYAKCDHTDTGDQCVCPSCSHSGKKVCGSDGKTYRDSCELKKHSCKTNQHIKVILQSECAGKSQEKKKSVGALGAEHHNY